MAKTEPNQGRRPARNNSERDRPDDRTRSFVELSLASPMRLAGILEIADDAIISVDAQQRITLFNQGAEKIFGYGAQEVLGQPLDLLLPARVEHIHRRHVAEFASSDETARRMAERRDIYGRRKDGTEFPAEASISKLEIEGELIFTVILRDITERKRVEQTLQEKNVELEQASLAKDRFLASMSHELRTPLNAIIGFTGTLLMKLPGPLTADQEKQLKTIQGSARHLLSLINDILDLAKIEAGKVEISLEPVDCQEVIAEVVASLRPLAEVKGLQFEVLVPNRTVFALADRRAFSQILINLVNNAIKFTHQGLVRLELHKRSEKGRTMTAISVVDTGVGIRSEDQAHLFNAFERGKTTAVRTNEGAGLGLHLSQKLAVLLDGYVEVQSEYGQGSTFTLLVPEHR
jgi:protein-histidine pros-kinase